VQQDKNGDRDSKEGQGGVQESSRYKRDHYG